MLPLKKQKKKKQKVNPPLKKTRSTTLNNGGLGGSSQLRLRGRPRHHRRGHRRWLPSQPCRSLRRSNPPRFLRRSRLQQSRRLKLRRLGRSHFRWRWRRLQSRTRSELPANRVPALAAEPVHEGGGLRVPAPVRQVADAGLQVLPPLRRVPRAGLRLQAHQRRYQRM